MGVDGLECGMWRAYKGQEGERERKVAVWRTVKDMNEKVNEIIIHIGKQGGI